MTLKTNALAVVCKLATDSSICKNLQFVKPFQVVVYFPTLKALPHARKNSDSNERMQNANAFHS